MERRKQKRMETDYEMFLRYRDKTIMVRSRDITTQGISILSQASLDGGEQVDLNFILPRDGLNLALKGKVIYCIQNPERSGRAFPYIAGVEFFEEANEVLIPVETKGDLIITSASHTLAIDAPAEKCYRMMYDFNLYPKWSILLDKVRILDLHDDGRGRNVEFQANVLFRKVVYVLQYSYDDENLCLSWTSVGGDILSTKGRYFFKPIGQDRTYSTYELDVSIDFYVPKRMVRFFSNIMMPRVMKGFKKMVEQNGKVYFHSD